MPAFTTLVMELIRRTAKREPERFAATAVPANDLAKLGKFVTDLAKLKMSGAVKPMPTMALPDNGTVLVEESAGDMKGNAALEASVDLVA